MFFFSIILFLSGGCLGYLITATDWSESFLSYYIQGQEKLTFLVILLFLSITLCFTLASANEKVPSNYDYFAEHLSLNETPTCSHLFPLNILRQFCSSIANSVRTIITMPFVLRRLTLADCCSWCV